MKSGRKQNSNISLKRILDYLSGKPTNREKNRLEREAMSDPFDADALEGLSQLSAEELNDDMNELRNRIQPKGKKRTFPVFLRVAAVALALVVSSLTVLYFINSNSQKNDIARAVNEEADLADTMERSDPPITKKPDPRLEPNSETPALFFKNESTGIFEEEIAEIDEVVIVESTELDYPKTTTSTQKIAPDEDLEIEGILQDKEGQPVAAAAVRVKETNIRTLTNSQGEFKLKLKSQEPVTLEADRLDSRNELTLMSKDSLENMYETSESYAREETKAARVEEALSGKISGVDIEKKKVNIFRFSKNKEEPEPLGGFAKYKRYLKENVETPANSTGKREKVLLELTIGIQGEIIKIIPLETPNESYTNSAIEAINKGPKWTPGTIKNKPTISKLELKIVFEK